MSVDEFPKMRSLVRGRTKDKRRKIRPINILESVPTVQATQRISHQGQGYGERRGIIIALFLLACYQIGELIDFLSQACASSRNAIPDATFILICTIHQPLLGWYGFPANPCARQSNEVASFRNSTCCWIFFTATATATVCCCVVGKGEDLSATFGI
jgi:hypothetical protein